MKISAHVRLKVKDEEKDCQGYITKFTHNTKNEICSRDLSLQGDS